MEVDLRSSTPENRTLCWFVNGIQQKCFFYNLPATVKMGILIQCQGDCIEFISFDELQEPTKQPKRNEIAYTFEGMEV